METHRNCKLGDVYAQNQLLFSPYRILPTHPHWRILYLPRPSALALLLPLPTRRRRAQNRNRKSAPSTCWAARAHHPVLLVAKPPLPSPNSRAFFIFIFFENIFYRNIFSISHFTVLYPYRPAGGRQGACRPAAGRQGLICKLKKIICAEALGGSLPPPWRAAGPLPPTHCIKGFPSPSPLICFPRHPESGRERGGVRERVVTAKPCRILDPNRR